jgi:uncharacterized damage-inducible protein DinB
VPGNAPPLTDERQLLLAYIAQQRDGIRNAAHGLTDDQARLTPTAGALSIGGIVKHVTLMERTWIGMVEQRPDAGGDQDDQHDQRDQGDQGGQDDYETGFQFGPSETLAVALADLHAAAEETEAAINAVTDLGQAVPVPKDVPWFPADVEAWTVRWVLLHLIEELARHAGHADIVRESIDGATMFPLMAAVEGWPATEWLQPWSAPPTPEPTT